MPKRKKTPGGKGRDERSLDKAIEASMPASDPPAAATPGSVLSQRAAPSPGNQAAPETKPPTSLEQEASLPVVQITFIEAAPGHQDEALALMKERANFMSRQPGFVSISLHRSLDGQRIVNYIRWQGRELLRRAHHSPEFRKEWERFDHLTGDIDPHLYEVAHARERGGDA